MSACPKVVFVTGCSQGGIGFSLCEEFASQGCKVCATARRLERMEGFTHDSIQCLHWTSQARRKILEKEGRIDIIVNNAAPLIDVPMELVLNTFNTNAFSVLRVARVVIPHMAERRSGTIVNISSIVGETPMPWSGIYASSKACVTTLSEVLYMECMPFNISHASHPCQGPEAMPAEVFAKTVVTAAISKRPPRYLTLGSNSMLLRFFK
ncbi:hypothetical protein BKA93DRAFT_886012 [Sparassis latifolia]